MIEYRRAAEEDLPMIVDLHIICFPDYFLTSLGKNLLYSFYKSFYDECNLFIVAYDNEKMIGFIMGQLDKSVARRNFERENALSLFFRLFWLCLRLDKEALKRCKAKLFKKKSSGSQLTFSHQSDATGLSLGVLHEYRRKSVAARLMSEFESLLKQYKVVSCTGSVRRENHKMQNFYIKNGYSIVEEASDSVRFLKNLE